MGTTHAQRLRLRLFLEGVEIPIIAANIQAMPNSPCVATIQVPPLAEGTRLLPRTVVHLFFLDLYTASSPFIGDRKNARGEDGTKNDPSAHEAEQQEQSEAQETTELTNSLTDLNNANYRLLFAGELVGFQWMKNVAQRSLVLQCEDFSNYWDYAYQWNNDGIFGPGYKALFSGGATNLFTDFLTSKGSVLTAIVSSGKCNTFPNLKGLAAGIVRLIEAIGGTYFPRPGSPSKKIAGQNVFFSLAELRLHITQMIAAFEDDPTSHRLLQRQGWGGMFDRALGGMGGQVSIRQAINALTKVIFHETYPQPCPLYIPGDDGSVSGTKRTKVKGHPEWGFVSDVAEEVIDGLEAVKASLDALTASEETAGPGSDGAVQAARRRLQLIQTTIRQAMVRLRGSPPPSQSIYSTASQAVGVAAARMSQWRPKAPDTIKKGVTDKIDEAIDQLKRAVDLTVVELANKQGNPARLVQQILRPDIWFGAPPRCNVFFPESYDTLIYERKFLQEPTRFLLKTNDEFFGEDEFFDKFYFAPRAGSVKADHAQLSGLLRGDVLDHELFTGILPVFEKMGEFNVFAAKTGAAEGNVPKIGFGQRSANFLYFKHRFNARRMQVMGKFNPYIAVGFPGLVIDKYVDSATIALHNELREKNELPPQEIGKILGTNFLGNFTQVSHSVSQSPEQGRTEVICSYPRQPEESIEFLGALEEFQKVQKREDTDAVRATDIAAVNPPKLLSMGPNTGRITNVTDVTSLYAIRTPDAGKQLPLFDVDVDNKRRGNPVLVDVATTKKASEFGAEVVTIVGDPDREVRFKAFRITEEVPRYRREEVTLPAEEFIRPGWYGDVWHSSKIGKVYEAFFATGAITDPQTVVGTDGRTVGQASEEEEQALMERALAEDGEDPRLDGPSALVLDEGSSIQQAVEFLHLTYSYIRQQGLDVEEFIRSYSWRPVASLVDIFGSSDLVFTENGDDVAQGVEGFHSRAFGARQDLFGLVGPEIEDVVGVKRGSPAAQKIDTRLRKLQAVQQYISALRFSRAILG